MLSDNTLKTLNRNTKIIIPFVKPFKSFEIISLFIIVEGFQYITT